MIKLIKLLPLLLLLVSCESVESVLSGVDYGCADIDGYFTDSNGRAIKVPDGVELTPELINELCD